MTSKSRRLYTATIDDNAARAGCSHFNGLGGSQGHSTHPLRVKINE